MQNKVEVSTRIKICGLKDEETIREMDSLPIDYIGLVFAPSKRQVSFDLGRRLIESIHRLKNSDGNQIKAVAVCVNMSHTVLNQLVSETKVDIIQLHGDEDTHYIEECKKQFPDKEVWKAISVKDELSTFEQSSRLKTYVNMLDAVVLDAPGGGTGKVFNWDAINLYQQITSKSNTDLIIAGGLNEHNVLDLLQKHQITGIDVSSGVETNGIKDITKIKGFVGKVREHDTDAR